MFYFLLGLTVGIAIEFILSILFCFGGHRND